MHKQIKSVILSCLFISTAVFSASVEDFSGGEIPNLSRQSEAPEQSASLPELCDQLRLTELDSWAPRLSVFFKKRSKFQPSIEHEIAAFDKMMNDTANAIVELFRTYENPRAHITTFFESPELKKCLRTLSMTGKIRSVKKTLEIFDTFIKQDVYTDGVMGSGDGVI